MGSFFLFSNTGDDNNNLFDGDIIWIDLNDPILGNADAKISILEYSDFQCPYCAKAYVGAITDFKNSNYFSNGDVNLVYKQFPLNSIHPFAQKAAEASLCAQDQGKFWDYHNLLFANQNALTTSNLREYASLLSLNESNFSACLSEGKYEEEVIKETSIAFSLGASGTPFFVILNNENGKVVAIPGAYPWEDFEAAIKEIS